MWWSVADGRVYVLVGEDDEVRAVAVTIPLSTVHEVLALAEKEPQQLLHPVHRAHGANRLPASQTRRPGPLLTVPVPGRITWIAPGRNGADMSALTTRPRGMEAARA